jgi:hypothetical protein
MTIQNEDYVLAFKEYLEELKKSAGFKIKLHTRSSPDSTSDPNAIIFKLQNNDLNQTMYLRVPFLAYQWSGTQHKLKPVSKDYIRLSCEAFCRGEETSFTVPVV